MKKKLILFFIIFIFLILLIIFYELYFGRNISYHYEPQKAIEYSFKYIDNRNPDFPNFQSNCINYISQCLIAGGIKMDGPSSKKITSTKIRNLPNKWFCYSFESDTYKPTSYYLSASFSNIKSFTFYWNKIAHVPYHTIKNTTDNLIDLKDKVKIGDILIFHGEDPHSAIIVGIDENDIYYNSNTNDRNSYPLSMISSDEYSEISYFNFVDNSH